jgi:hypothetical protein
MNGERERTWKEAVVAWFKNLPGGTEGRNLLG